MFDLKLTSFGNGTIRYFANVEPVPATSETTGSVTINNAGQEGVPGHFETTFMISVDVSDGGASTNNTFHWSDIVLADRADVSYREVEDKAARRLAPMLRTLADKIDQAMAEFDVKQKAKKTTS